MKRIAAFAIIVALALISSAEAAKLKESLFVTHKEAKIRAGPSTAYSVLWRPRMYTPLEILVTFKDEKDQLWYVVRDVAGDVGWINNSTVTKEQGAIVIVKMVDIRKKGSSTAKLAYRAPKNYTFKVLQESKGWYKVEDPDGDKGWVRKQDVWTGKTPFVTSTMRVGSILGDCQSKWGDDYSMVKYCVEQQEVAQRDVSSRQISPEIMIRCKNKWGDDYSMVKYCVEQQEAAQRDVSSRQISPEIMSRCKNKWGDDYSMVKYCIEQQEQAKDSLGY